MSLPLEIKQEPDERKDPTSFLPQEEMSYEIKKKKKKKKKKKQEDPFKDVEAKLAVFREPDITALDPDIGSLDPEVSIKVEDIEVDLNVEEFHNDVGLNEESFEECKLEPTVKLEDQSAVVLTFQNIVRNNLIKDKYIKRDNRVKLEPLGENHFCEVCHLVFKTAKSLDTHRKRTHKHYRKSFSHICDDCGMAYQFKNSLVAHIRRKHGPDVVKDDMLERTCDLCALVFKGQARIRMHMRRKHGFYQDSFNHECEYCGLTYEKQCSLLVHIRRKHTHKTKPRKQWLNCPFCGRFFDKRETYTRHIQRNHKVNDEDGKLRDDDAEFKQAYTNEKTGELTCSQCPLAFSTVGYLKWHMRRKHNVMLDDFKLKCKICNLSYANSESLKRHVRRKHDKGTFCYVCNRQYADRDEFLKHSHSKVVKECTICGLIFANQGGLGKHMRTTHKLDGPKNVMCPVCNQGFVTKRQLKLHYNRVHLKLTYTCKYCEKVLKTRECYRKHVMTKHPTSSFDDTKMHQCDKCPESFKDEFELCKHNNFVHGDMPPIVIKKEEDDIKNVFKCTKCADEFDNWELLRVHFEQLHHMVEEVQCQVCGSMLSRGELPKHMKVHDEIEVQCRYCEFKSKNRVSMTQHMLRHKNATTLHCDYTNCRYKTFYDDAMLKHKRRHQVLGVKLQCASCPFQTMNKYILKYHEEAHSTGKKRYKCDKCDYATILPANLVQHKYKHSLEKKFKCEVCSFATKYNTSLRFHVKTKHCDLPSVSKD